jgi:hypothetical protein
MSSGTSPATPRPLTRLASWARTGVETPMYADREQRSREIERSAELPRETLRAEVAGTAAALAEALAELAGAQWSAEVRSALGRAVPAAEVPWMRIREVWLHAVDLDAGARIDDLPTGVLDLLLDDVSTALSAKDDCPSLELALSAQASRQAEVPRRLAHPPELPRDAEADQVENLSVTSWNGRTRSTPSARHAGSGDGRSSRSVSTTALCGKPAVTRAVARVPRAS